jgi:DNA-directed RNA polymerase specialized sigma24 family protein
MSTTDPPDGDARFRRDLDSTCWSVVIAAGDQDSQIARTALATLCEVYWYPVYAYLRRRVRSVDEAQDLTQAFFARLIEKNYIAAAQQDRGRFRAYLLTAVKHFLANERQKTQAEKRGGGRTVLSLDVGEGERRYALEPASDKTAEALFDQQWAVTLVNHVLDRLRDEFLQAGKAPQFDALKTYLAGRSAESTYEDAAAKLGMSAAAARVAVHRMRQRYRELLRQEIAQTVSTPADTDDEIRRLFTSLGT